MKGFIFDLNGTMIDDMQFHLRAWTHMLNDRLGANLSPEEVKAQMYGKNSEMLERVFGKGRFTQEEMDRISLEKELQYQAEFGPHLKLINGLHIYLLRAAENGIPMAIGSAAIPFNIDFVLDNLEIRHFFTAIVSADDVKESKPHPEVFLKAASMLSVDPKDCIVFEDAPKGAEAAFRAGMDCVALTTLHRASEFSSYNNVKATVANYLDPVLQQFLQ